MTEPPIEEPVEDWIEQQTLSDPDEERLSTPESVANIVANEADVLEQREAVPDPTDNYRGTTDGTDAFPDIEPEI